MTRECDSIYIGSRKWYCNKSKGHKGPHSADWYDSYHGKMEISWVTWTDEESEESILLDIIKNLGG